MWFDFIKDLGLPINLNTEEYNTAIDGLSTDLECIIYRTPLGGGEIFHGRRRSMEVVFCRDYEDWCNNCEIIKYDINNLLLCK